MDTNEIMVNEEVVETTEQITKVGSRNGCKIAVGIGLTVFAGVMAYKYVVKPMLAKIKDKKNQQEVCEEEDIIDADEFEVESNEEDE